MLLVSCDQPRRTNNVILLRSYFPYWRKITSHERLPHIRQEIVMLYKVVLTFESVDDRLSLKGGTGNVRGTYFWVSGWNREVWPFKWNLLSSTFLWCCLLCCTRPGGSTFWVSRWKRKCDHCNESNWEVSVLSYGTNILENESWTYFVSFWTIRSQRLYYKDRALFRNDPLKRYAYTCGLFQALECDVAQIRWAALNNTLLILSVALHCLLVQGQ